MAINYQLLCLVIVQASLLKIGFEQAVASTCPALPRGIRPYSQNNECYSDSDCPRNMKCCPTLIGKVCMHTEQMPGWSAIQPPTRQPRPQTQPAAGGGSSVTCSDGRTPVSPCPCLSGYYCRRGYCCKRKYRKGRCPSMSTITPNMFVGTLACLDDYDCSPPLKCCRSSTSTEKHCVAATSHSGPATTTPVRTVTPSMGTPPSSCAGENEEPSRCAPLCPPSCDNMYQTSKCSGCKPGCACKYGFYRLSSSDPTSPCVSDVMCYQVSHNKNCPDGARPLGTCAEYRNQCPARYVCQNDLCCPGPKPGSCPFIPNQEAVAESLQCTGDGQCEGNKKCCATSKGGRCLTPLPTFGANDSQSNIFGGSRVGQTVGKVASLLGFGDLLKNIGSNP